MSAAPKPDRWVCDVCGVTADISQPGPYVGAYHYAPGGDPFTRCPGSMVPAKELEAQG